MRVKISFSSKNTEKVNALPIANVKKHHWIPETSFKRRDRAIETTTPINLNVLVVL